MDTNVLSQAVLLLNKSFSPIDVITVKDAILLLFCDKAEIVSHDGTGQLYTFNSWREVSALKKFFVEEDDHIGTNSSERIIAPRILRLSDHNGFHKTKVNLSRKNLLIRDNYTCQYCGKKITLKTLSIDHVIPQSKGGKTVWDNVVSSCRYCNIIKDDLSVEEAGLKLRRKPTKPSSLPSFSMFKHKKYVSWEMFVSHLYWNVPLED